LTRAGTVAHKVVFTSPAPFKVVSPNIRHQIIHVMKYSISPLFLALVDHLATFHPARP
jgi:hypothetical protein